MNRCMYCSAKGTERISEKEGGPIYTCNYCWIILQNPKTALPFLRGHLTLQLRGKMPSKELDAKINLFMKTISEWKRPG